MGEAYKLSSFNLFKRISQFLTVGQGHQHIARMVKYVAHPLNYRKIGSYDLGLASWLHFPARNDLRAGAGVTPDFVPSSAVPAFPLLGDALNLSSASSQLNSSIPDKRPFTL